MNAELTFSFLFGVVAGVILLVATLGIWSKIDEFRDWKKRVNKLLEATEETKEEA